MAVEVRVPTILRSYTGGQKVVTGSGDTLAELLTDLDAQFPGLRGRLVTEEGTLHKFVNIYVNDEDVRFIGALDAKLNDGDTVTVLPAVAGGAGLRDGAGGAGLRDGAGGAGLRDGAGGAGPLDAAMAAGVM
jgi:molybdopterin synthase sulfur carrier subunit